MKLFILLLTLIFTLQIHADDLCYQQPESGGNLAFPQRLFPIQNISSSNLENVQVQYAIKGFAMSFNKKIGIDNKKYTNKNDYNSSNGQDKAENADWFRTDFGHGMPDFSIFDKGVNYHLETMASNDINKVWTSQFIITDFMSSFFSTKKLFATYTKAGINYTVILNPCGSEVPAISIEDQTLQAQTTATTMDFNISISGMLNVGDNSYVHYYTMDGTAKSGSDYTAVDNTIVIPKGTTSASISVPIKANASGEFYLILDNAYLARIDDGNATGTINQALSKIGEYRFDLCSLGGMVDSSASGNDGGIQNVETEDIYPRHEEKGMVCRAGRFYSFVANYATAGKNLQTDVNGAFSILLSLEWSGNHGDLPIISKANDYSLKINEGKLFYKLGSDSDYTEVPNFSISQNTAYSLAFIATGSKVKVYKDATLTDSMDHNYSHIDNSNTTYIGTEDKVDFYSGLLDEINFYKGIIKTDTITQHAQRSLRPCACCPSPIKIKGDYVRIGDTYNASRLPWDSVSYNGFRFDEPPLVFMLPSDNGGHSAYIRAKNVTETGFEAANIEPQGEDGPHIAMDLSYIAVSRGVHDLGDHTLEACTIPVQTVQWHDRGTPQDVNLSNRTPYGTISCDSSGCWTKIAVNGSYENPVVFATIITAENELRDENDNASGREVSRPWMTVAIKNDDSGIWVSLERSETTYGKITKPELIAYMITEGNIQSSFTDDFENNVSYETIYVKDRFLGYNKRNDSDQRFNFVNTYQTNPKPLVMANKQSRKDPDGGWFRLNGSPQATNLRVSIWEDRRGSFSAEGNWDNPADPTTPIGVSANQDTERTRDKRDDGAAIVFGGTFQYAESFQPTAGNFDAVENNATYNTKLDTKIVNKPFQLKYWSLDRDDAGNVVPYVINSPVKTELIYSQNSGINLDCNNSTNLVIPNSTKYTHFIQPNPYINSVNYNLTDSTAYRNVQVRFTFAADANGSTVNWLPCYNNSRDCGDSTYTAACTSICTQNPSSARSEQCAQCYIENIAASDTKTSCSYDRFAIRPDKFDIFINGTQDNNQTIAAGTSFLIDANATVYNATSAAQNYNALQAAAGTLPQFHVAPTDLNEGSGCTTGLIVDIDDSNFTNGVFSDSNGKYTEVGDINITVFEDPNKVFANVDMNNPVNPSLNSSPEIYTIGTTSIGVHFTPDHFKVTSSIKDFTPGYTYLSRDLNISSELNVTITAKNAENNTTSNYYDKCYSKKTNLSISYNTITLQPAASLSNILLLERNTSTNTTFALNNSINLVNLNENIFSSVDKGTAKLNMKINFDRDKNESVNPFKFTIKDINVSDSQGITGNQLNVNKSSTFVYARTNSPRQRFVSPIGASSATPAQQFIYYEVYCETGCDRSLLPNGIASVSTDDPRWFINPGHTALSGNAGSVHQKGFAVGSGNVIGSTTSGNAPDSTSLVYDGTKGYPYKTTMENNASSWLIYNKYDVNDDTNEFEVEFTNSSGDWAGQHESDAQSMTNKNAADRTNRRSMW